MAVIYVDVIERGSALVTGPGFSGRVGRDEGRYYVELTASDTRPMDDPAGTYRWTVSNYQAAAIKLARLHGLKDLTVKIERER